MSKRPFQRGFALPSKPMPALKGEAPVSVRYVCPVCGGGHPKAECISANAEKQAGEPRG